MLEWTVVAWLTMGGLRAPLVLQHSNGVQACLDARGGAKAYAIMARYPRKTFVAIGDYEYKLVPVSCTGEIKAVPAEAQGGQVIR